MCESTPVILVGDLVKLSFLSVKSGKHITAQLSGTATAANKHVVDSHR